MLTGERPDAGIGAATLRVSPSAVHRDLDTRHDRLVLTLLAPAPEHRPADAFEARRALAALPWPDTIERAAMPRSERPKSDASALGRLVPIESGMALDRWLDRRVVTTTLSPLVLARASAFARADHSGLQAILRVDRATQTLWLAAPRGAAVGGGRLTAPQAAFLREALGRLHAVGEVHGSVDGDHVWVDTDGTATLLFTTAVGPTATADLDRLSLAKLV
jgi:serine/threonine-protein kinase